MEYLSFGLCLLLAWVAIHFFISRTRYSKSNSTILPPGPRPLPIIGNLLSLGNNPHKSLAKLARTYGPLMTLQLGRVPTVIISSAAVAKAALQMNDLCFSRRNIVDAIRALNHHENSVVWLPADSQWRKLRKILNSQLFSTSRLDTCQSIRRDKVKILVSYIESCSEAQVAIDIGQAAFNTTLNMLSSTLFSMDMSDPSSEFAGKFRDTIRGIMEEAGKPNLADYFPILKKIDPQGIRRRTSVHFQKMMDLFTTLIDERLQGTKPARLKEAGNDVLDVLLGISQEKTEEIEPSTILHLLLDLFAAGTDTTSTTIEWAMAELLHNTEKMKKAQLELREVIGNSRLLEESDISQLPYLQAIIKETLRLHPPVPLLIPRKVDSDVKLFGFTVPKNSQVLVNAWAIGRDADIWQNPDSFKPERFLGSQIDVRGHDFELIPFGAGRRICPGLPLAIRMLHLILGSLIHGFDWNMKDGISQEEINMDEKFGITLEKAQRLHAIPVRFCSNSIPNHPINH